MSMCSFRDAHLWVSHCSLPPLGRLGYKCRHAQFASGWSGHAGLTQTRRWGNQRCRNAS